MEPSSDAISVRLSRINNHLLNKVKDKSSILSREGLLDSLQVLYDECNADYMKNNDKNIAKFVDKFKRTMNDLKKLRVNLTDFDVKNVIGRGHFGEVHVVKERQTGDVYAMKTVRKYENSETKCVAFAEERNIMAQASSEWITRLQFAFQDNNNLYFIMDYHPGGDLLGLLYRQGGTIPESAATFYLAELVLAIHAVHDMGYIHRDIKPDNILLDRCGHIKLADFGSAAKMNADGLVASGSVPVGTPDYIAPEALQSVDNKTGRNRGNYGRQCDYWSLGVLAFELTIGTTPFTGLNTTATYSKIINHAKTFKLPADISLTQSYIHLIKSLLVDQHNRLGYEKIVKHLLFKSIDFNHIRNQVPPFVPKILSLEDTSNFSDLQKKRKEPNIDNFKSKLQFTGKNLPFIGFTYTVEPKDATEQYRSSILLKDDQTEKLRGEIDELNKKLIKNEATVQDKDAIEKKLEDKARKLESVESVRDKLERDLANNIAECQALKRTLDLERKDRTDLERKALELIKSAKTKWEVAEKQKLDNINKELADFKLQNEKLSDEIAELNQQLQRVVDKNQQHKVSIENVEKLRRSSVIGLESRLEKVTTETQTKISQLQSQLAESIESKHSIQKQLLELETAHSHLQNQYDITQKENNELKNKCKESTQVINTLKKDVARLEEKAEDLEFHKALIKTLEEDIEELKNDQTTQHQLKLESESNAVMKKQIKDLKGELNSIRSSKLSALEDMKSKHGDATKNYEQELKKVKDDKAEVEIKLQEVQLTLKSKEEKVQSLDELLQQLQNDLSKLDAGSEREIVLQEQIERLEHQLVEVSSSAALEKQELSNLKSKFWRLEKDLSNAQVDKRIVERELKAEQKKTCNLENEIKQLEQTIANNKKSNDVAIVELGDLNEKMSFEVEKLKMELDKSQIKLKMQEEREGNNKETIERLKTDGESKELKICSLLDVLDSLKCEKLVLQQKLEDSVSEKNQAQNRVDGKNKEMSLVKIEVEKYKTDLENSLLNRKALREACTLLENQLIEFETVLDASETKRNEMQAEIHQLEATVVQLKNDMQEARRHYNEEKSLKLLAETKIKRLVDDCEHQQNEIKSFQEENSEFKQYSAELSKELSNLELKLADQDATIKSFERQIDDFVDENNYLKEENSEQLTFINSVKESNYTLNHRLGEAQATIRVFMEKIEELDALLNEKTQYFNERELKAESTMQQQTKLIDYLQSKVEEFGKKKKTLSDKLFGHSKKENLPPLSVALNYKDLEGQLTKEREQNKALNQEIIKLKAGMYKKGEAEIKNETVKSLMVQDEILAQIVYSPTSQKNDLYRQNSIQRMHHNIPHRFDSKLCTKAVKCAQCSNLILLGRHMHVCRECHATAHTNCANSLPRTCGLPTEFAMHYSESLNKLHSASSSSINDIRKREVVNVEGWVKVPKPPTGWDKYYACLTASTLSIFNEPPNNDGIKPVQALKLHNANEHGKVILEPVPSEVPVPVANSDLPFVIKVETSPNSTCWPSQCIIFMALSIEDKERWHKALQSIFHTNDKSWEIVLQDTEDMQVNCLYEISKDIKLLGTDSGLYSLNKTKCVRIAGPASVFEIVAIPAINTAMMIAEENRILITCDLKHLSALAECAPCSKPTLQYRRLCINNIESFHILKAADFQRSKVVCTATNKKLALLKYDAIKHEFHAQRILDTAQPTSCILFTEHSIIIGADKFFEIDLNSYEADEFLDASDAKLSNAIQCFQMQSFPLSVQYVSKPPEAIEYLVCFNEFATFVDEYGRSTRTSDISWMYMPKAVCCLKDYLYVVQFNSVEIYKIDARSCNGQELQLLSKIDMPSAQWLGDNDRGIYVLSGKQIKYIDARYVDDAVSLSSEITSTLDVDHAESDRFSFTSSMIQDDVLSCDFESGEITSQTQITRRVKFTDL